MDNTYFEKVFKTYSSVKVPKENQEFYKIDKIVYYLSDLDDSKITASNVWEVDIKSAFPTICNHIFAKDDPFLIHLNELTNKLEKNIFISTTLKDTQYLKQLNYIAKMIISSVVMTADPEATIFELKKDGIIYKGNPIKETSLYDQFITDGYEIKQIPYTKYMRFLKTSYYLEPTMNLIIKGIYKERPAFLTTISENLFNGTPINEDDLIKYYSQEFFQVVKQNNLDELLLKYYLTDSMTYINNSFRYEKLKGGMQNLNIYARNYLKLFVFPLMKD